MTDHSLTLGSLLLTDSPTDDDHGFFFNVIANGATFGKADPVRAVILSLLADGDLVRTKRFGNREVSFGVEITGPDLASVAQGEAALRREIGRGNTLTWQAPDVLAVPTVFEVVDSDMSQTFDDLDELRRKRTFVMTLTCAPFARSENPTTVEALTGGTTTVSVDTCDSATGWTGTYEGAPAVVSTAWEAGSVGVAELDDTVTAPDTWTMTRTGAVDFTSTPYLLIEVRTLSSDAAPPLNVTAAANGAPVPLMSVRRVVASAYYEAIYDLSGVGATSSLTFTHTSKGGEPWSGMFIRQVSRTDVPPSASPRQLSRIIDVGGTERTPGSLLIAAPDGTTPLQLTLAATWPENGSGFSPPLRRWRVSGNTETSDANTLSGKREAMGPSFIHHDVSTSSLPPGTYQLMALMRSVAAGPYVVEAAIQSRHNGVTLGETTWGAGGTETVTFPVANDWKLVPMGVYGVPIVAAKAGEFRVIFRTPSSTDVEYDEAWLFPVDDDCGLTVVQVAEPHLWLDSPDTENSVPSIWEGASADKSDAHFPRYGIHTMGSHIFTPSATVVFTATFGVEYAEATLEHFKRWHSNAAED